MHLLFGIVPHSTLLAQTTEPDISRFTHCVPPRPPQAPLEEQTLCQQYPNLNPTTAYKVIGADQSSISYSSNEKDPSSPLGWSGKTMVINGTLYIDELTLFIDCTIKMGPGARMIVQGNQSIEVFFSRIFACDQMWEGIRLEQNSNGSFWYCHIQDANNAIHTTRNAPIAAVHNRFNRNNVGIRSAFAAPGGTALPTSLVTTFFFGNEFTMSSSMNNPYPGQSLAINWPTGILLRNSSASIPGLAGAPNRFSRLGYGIHIFGSSLVTIGNAQFTGQDVAGIWSNRCFLNINAANPCHFKDNYVAGIWTKAGNTNISGCTFGADEYQLYGIITERSGSTLFQNNFVLDKTHIAAVYCERGSHDIHVVNNTIDITSLANGIMVETPTGVSAQGVCSVDDNKITINENGQADNIGIHVIGGTGDNFQITYNTLDIRPQGGMFYNIRGILFEQCTGLDHLVSGNTIFNALDDKSAAAAIYIRGVQNGVYCLNTTDDSFDGMVFFGNNFPADVERNYFDHHNYSLVVDGNAFSPAVIGQQVRKANAWNPEGYKVLAAVCTGDAELSQFFIHSPNVLYFPPPPFVSPPTNWFIDFFGDPNPFNTCVRRPEASGDFEIQIAEGTYFASSTSPLVQWELKRNLYYKMLRNSNYGQENPAFAAFFSANASTSAGKFAKVERDLYLAGTMSASLLEDLAEIATQRDSLLLQLAQLEASQQPPSEPEPVNVTFANAKHALLDDLSELGEEEATLLDQHFANVAAQLATIRAYNQAIPVTHTFEANQKAINEIGIKMALGEPLLQSDLTTLENIAEQPDSTAGTTQWRAASMLPCRVGVSPRSNGHDERPSVLAEMAQKEAFQQLFVAPNPVSDEVNVRFQQPFTGTLTLLDAFGRSVREVAVSETLFATIVCQGLPNGIYYLQAQGDKQKPRIAKCVIAN